MFIDKRPSDNFFRELHASPVQLAESIFGDVRGYKHLGPLDRNVVTL
jgi:hypothetical protein